MRVDGKFMVGNDIPEGQGSVNALLAECFEISHDLRVQADENESEWTEQPSWGGNIDGIACYFQRGVDSQQWEPASSWRSETVCEDGSPGDVVLPLLTLYTNV